MLPEKKNRDARIPLTNACKRWIITLGNVMLKVKAPNGVDIECETADEAIELLRRINEEQAEVQDFERRSPDLPYGTKRAHLWRVKKFQQFIDALGDTQRQIMNQLVRQTRMTDETLRKLINARSNQQLAGVLSGISKQAAALDIPARSVYTIENESRSGKVQKTYVVADDFWRMAEQMNWPGD